MKKKDTILERTNKKSLQNRRFYEKNKEKIHKQVSQYGKLHKNQISKRKKMYYNLKKQIILEKQKIYYRNNRKCIEKRNNSTKTSKIDNIKCKNFLAKKIKRKYKNINFKKSTGYLLRNKERFVKSVMEKLLNTSFASDCRIEADRLVTTAIYVRDNYTLQSKNTLRNLKKIMTISLTRLGDTAIEGNEELALNALCGISKHTSSSEAYFTEAAYNFQNNLINSSIIVNKQGQCTNILPAINTKTKNKVWECTNHCKTKGS